ncbi:hypothetical protein [Limnohabitans sp. 2KL-1]|jgi:hypothetical protein|uniref:hypothetical protein n=1 Tax=Limnohabitans sp. 2KL-1 TaxID=1100699 RepID=UPI001304D724|nr:hypothetical protein [Limnohabitans sp. 2KL-1]
MKNLTRTLSFALLNLGTAAWAHDGHGLGGSHWHSTDVLGFVVATALVALAVYFGKK